MDKGARHLRLPLRLLGPVRHGHFRIQPNPSEPLSVHRGAFKRSLKEIQITRVDPVESKPKLTGKRPKVVNFKPKLTGKRPKVTNFKPKLTNKEPKVINFKPKLINKEPKVINFKPKLINKRPKVINFKPKLTNKRPKTSGKNLDTAVAIGGFCF